MPRAPRSNLPHAGLTALAAALAMLAAPVAADTLAPDLRARLESAAPGEKTPVIIQLAERIDPRRYQQDRPQPRDRTRQRREILQDLRSQADRTQPALVASVRAQGGRDIRSLWTINAIATELPAAAIQALARHPSIARIRLDAEIPAPGVTPAAAATPEWNIATVAAPDLWNLGIDGTGTVVANMDSGVDAAHPDLVSRWRGGGNSWYDPNGQHATPYDKTGHGTQTMGLMVGGSAGGSSIGVAPGAQWIAVKIFDDRGYARTSRIHQGFQWLLDPDGNPATDDAPDVVNNSWSLGTTDQCYLDFQTDIQLLKAAGIGVVFAAGNDGGTGYTSNSPANNPEGYAVGATDASGAVASFSSRGPSACDGTTFPELMAPGVAVLSADRSFGGMPLYAYVSGTSFAAPHIAGVMALLRQAHPAADIATLESTLTQTAQDLGAPGPDNSYGYGMVNALAAHETLAGLPAPANRAPVAGNDAYSIADGTTLTVSAPGVLGNDSDPDGDSLSTQLEDPPSAGTLALNGDGSFTYTPNPGTVADSFTYRASDGSLVGNLANVSISVLSANRAPTANGDAYAMQAGSTLTVAAPGVLGNDSDPDGDALSAQLASPPNGGTLTLNGNGSFSYTPNAGTSSDSFSYRAGDGSLTSTAAIVSISVSQPNQAPLAVNDSATTGKNRAVSINVLANDSDPDGSLVAASVALVGAPNQGGRVSVSSNGTLSYRPGRNFIGSESFAYTVRDNLGAVSNTATVTVQVTP